MKHYLIDIDDTLYLHPRNKKMDYNISPNDKLISLLNECIYPKYIYTNATYDHANLIINRLNLQDKFIKIYSRDTMPLMKPEFESAIDVENNIKLRPENINKKHLFVFFDDLLPNLKTGKKRGWTTIWVSPLYESKNNYTYVDYAFPNINSALSHCIKYNI